MLEPHFDLGGNWQQVGTESVIGEQFGRTIDIPLSFRSDACLIYVTTNANQGVNWVRAGYFRQYYSLNGQLVRLTNKTANLKTLTLIQLEPTGESVLSFTPVDWLYDWQITIQARQVQNVNLTTEDILLSIADQQGLILAKLNQLEVMQNQAL